MNALRFSGAAGLFVFYVLAPALGQWTQIDKLLAGDAAADDGFGEQVSISGGTVVVGAMNDDDNGSGSGSAYVFVRCPGGVNGDGVIDLTDLGILLINFGTGTTRAEGDLNGVGIVDLTDLGILLINFGATCS